MGALTFSLVDVFSLSLLTCLSNLAWLLSSNFRVFLTLLGLVDLDDSRFADPMRSMIAVLVFWDLSLVVDVDIIVSSERSVVSESSAMEIAETTQCCDGAVLKFVDDVVVVDDRGEEVVETTSCVDDEGNDDVTLASVVCVDGWVKSSTTHELMIEDTGIVGSIIMATVGSTICVNSVDVLVIAVVATNC